MKQNKNGFIIIFSLLALATLTTIATYMLTRGSLYIPFVRTINDREKAKLLAQSGIEIAIAQLSQQIIKEESDNKNNAQKTPDPSAENRLFLAHFFPIINRWQEYVLTENIEGIDATIRLCLMCEEGKININTIYDYNNKKFIGEGSAQNDWNKLLQDFFKKIEQTLGGKELFKSLEQFLKQREYQINDITELLHIKEFQVFQNNQFYAPKKTAADTKNSLYLTDIFTTHSPKKTINPWFFSNSLLLLLSLPPANYNDTKERFDKIPEWLKSFRQPKTWKNDWDALLAPIYSKKLNSLPKNIESIFDISVTPRIFSVLSEGKVGTAVQQIFAILERTKDTHKEKTQYKVILKKLYWL